MDTEEPPGGDRGVWPPPPTQPPPTVAATPSPGLDKAWVFGQIFGRTLLFGMAFGAVGGAVYGGFLAQGFGIVFGLIYGVVAGVLLGLADGLAAAFVTCFGFFPLAQAKVPIYRNSITFITVVITLVGAWTLSLLLFGGWGNGTIAGGDTWMSVLPTIIATVTAGVASRRVTRWYVTVSATRT